MFNFVRKIVAGPKNRTIDQQYDLDLTYITDRIIAMAFPAAGFEKTYRNSINDVSKFMKQRHGQQYLIINASNRKYDYQKFNYQVLQYFWTDHQAPPLTTLFQLCEKIQTFIETNQQNVVAVHCNHGKGRTGTAIISYLLYSYQFTNVKKALDFYNLKRFSGQKYGVDQPCQLRYLNYFKQFMDSPIEQIQKPIKAFKLINVSQNGLHAQKQLFVRISQTRTQHIIYPSVFLIDKQVSFVRPLFGDIFIQLLQNSWTGVRQVLRINFNLYFLQKIEDSNKYRKVFQGKDISMKKKDNKENFQLTLEFEQFCNCHQSNHKKQCLCLAKRQRQQTYWHNMTTIIQRNRNRHQITKQSLINKPQKQQFSQQYQIVEHQQQNKINSLQIDQIQQQKQQIAQQGQINNVQQSKEQLNKQKEVNHIKQVEIQVPTKITTLQTCHQQNNLNNQ